VFDGFSASTLGASFTQVVFTFSLGPALIVQGAILAILVGIAGGLFPAIRGAHADRRRPQRLTWDFRVPGESSAARMAVGFSHGAVCCTAAIDMLRNRHLFAELATTPRIA